MTRVTGEPALVLHTRPYRETSQLVTLMTLHHGRVGAVARGVRGARATRRRHGLQPFDGLVVSWSGRSSLVTLGGWETVTRPRLHGVAIAAAFYVAELIVRLAGERDSLPRVYAGATWAMERLAEGDPELEVVLRSFEKLLIEELGYGLDFARDASTGNPLDPALRYRLDPARGFIAATGVAARYPGALLLRIAADDFSLPEVRRAAKLIMRRALAEHLGPRPLVSRRLLLQGRR